MFWYVMSESLRDYLRKKAKSENKKAKKNPQTKKTVYSETDLKEAHLLGKTKLGASLGGFPAKSAFSFLEPPNVPNYSSKLQQRFIFKQALFI